MAVHVRKLQEHGSLIKPPLSQRIKSGYVILHPGESVGEHVTDQREEVIVILEGVATVQVDDEVEIVHAGCIVYIPANKKHNITNNTEDELRYTYIVSLHV